MKKSKKYYKWYIFGLWLTAISAIWSSVNDYNIYWLIAAGVFLTFTFLSATLSLIADKKEKELK